MKEALIIIIILTIIIGGDVLINKYLENSSENLMKELENLKNKIDEGIYSIEDLKQEANSIYNKWQRIEEKWAMLVLHSELDQIEISLIKMKTEIEEENLDIAKEELEASIFLINHISEKEKFTIKNVF